MQKFDLIEKVAVELDTTKKDAHRIIEAVFDSITEGLVHGEKVKVNGFGTFVVKEKSERKGVNPKTNEAIVIPASKAAGFKAAEGLKAKIK